MHLASQISFGLQSGRLGNLRTPDIEGDGGAQVQKGMRIFSGQATSFKLSCEVHHLPAAYQHYHL